MEGFDFIKLAEEKLANYTNAPYAILVDSCTNGIFLALHLFEKKVITCPKRTYVGVPQSIIHAGHKVDFKDIKWEYKYNLSPTNIYDYAVYFEKDMYIPGTIQVLSFHYKKQLHINRGGAILLDNYEQYEFLRRLSFDGRDRVIKDQQISDISILGYHMMITPESACEFLLKFDRKREPKKITYQNYKDVSNYTCFTNCK